LECTKKLHNIKRCFSSIGKKENVVILGCGNILFGDDGFGSEVAGILMAEYSFPDNILIIDAGTSVRSLLFDLLLFDITGANLKQIIIVDVCGFGFMPGTIAEIPISSVSPAKINDFSLHQFPTINILKEINENTNIKLAIFAVQPEKIPEEVNPGLSDILKNSVRPMCAKITNFLNIHYGIKFNIIKEAA
jgi:coenzyme F420 hydrogenase subunit delta